MSRFVLVFFLSFAFYSYYFWLKMSIVKKEDTITEENVSTIANEQLMKVLPIGTILPFVGNQSLIPANWFMCDGANGTVDL